MLDERTVKRMIVKQPDSMPYYPKEKALQRGIDLAYGKRQITAQVTSGILQGESINQLSNRLQTSIPTMNRNSAIRAARTAVTGAQNAGRLDSYMAAEKLGIKLKKEWLATLDGRTRHEHAMLDGQSVPSDEPFEVGGYKLMFPGDPSGAPEMIYNCRCTMVADLEDVDTSGASRRARDPLTGKREIVPDMTYGEWAAWKKENGQIADEVLEIFQPMSDYRDEKGNFDIEKAKKDYINFLQSVPESYRMYLMQSVNAVEYREVDDNTLVFGYSPGRDTIYYNPKHPMFYSYDFGVAMTHELSHRIDYTMFIESWNDRAFSKAISDAAAIIAKEPTKFVSAADNFQCDLLTDILSGICEQNYAFKVGHPKGYWEVNGNKEKEIFANLFALEALQSEQDITFFKTNFPGIFDAYNNFFT